MKWVLSAFSCFARHGRVAQLYLSIGKEDKCRMMSPVCRVFPVLLMLLFPSNAASTSPTAHNPLGELPFSGLVIRGTVRAVQQERLSVQELTGRAGASADKLPNHTVTIAIDEVIKGTVTSNVVKFTMAPFCQLQRGDSVLVGLRLNQVFRRGWYFLNGLESLLLAQGDEWYRPTDKVVLSRGTVDSVLGSSQPSTVIKEAELVLSGRVTQVDTSKTLVETSAGPRRGIFLRWTFDVLEVYKGILESPTIKVTMQAGTNFDPPWRVPVPLFIQSGEVWFVCLRHQPEYGWIPFAGKNGMFKVSPGGALLYDSTVPLAVTVESLLKQQ